MPQLSVTNGHFSGTSIYIAISILFASLSATFIDDIKLQSLDKQANDEFGCSVAISNDYMVIGARYEDTGATSAGAAYVYEQGNFGEWKQIQKLQAADRGTSDHFGESVAISNDYIVIGSNYEDTGGDNAGAAYVYKRNTNSDPVSWDQIQKLQASDRTASDTFGYSVAIANEYIVIGAHLVDTGGDNAGAAYVYKLNINDGLFYEIEKLQASDLQASDYFGVNVAISNNFIVIGAHCEDTVATDAGAAYIFEMDNFGQWYETQKIQASNAQSNDHFGRNVAISNNYIVIGAYAADTGGIDAGAAYVFERDIDTNVWSQVQKLQSNDIESIDEFGISVDISNDYILIGAYKEDTGASDSGAAYVYKRNDNGVWIEIEKLKAFSNNMYGSATIGDYFGVSVSISNDKVVVGAHNEDTGGSNTGAVYVFRNPEYTSSVNSGFVRFMENNKCMTFDSDLFGFIMKTNDNTLEFYLDSTFKQISALNNEIDCFSFESIKYANYYISHGLQNGNPLLTLINLEYSTNKDSSTWCYKSLLFDTDTDGINRIWYPYGYNSQYYMKEDETQSNMIIVSKTDNTITLNNT